MYKDKCRCVEAYEPEHTYTFTEACIVMKKSVSVTVKANELFVINRGKLNIQQAAPSLTPDEREFLLSGTSKEGWDIMFPEAGESE